MIIVYQVADAMVVNIGFKLAGGYLFVEGLLSIARSQDQRQISNLGRLGRMTIGVWLFFRE